MNGTTIDWYAIWAQCQPCREAKGGEVKDKKWTHVVATYDGKASRLYQDGEFVVESKPGPNSDLPSATSCFQSAFVGTPRMFTRWLESLTKQQFSIRLSL
ncbi:TPA: hypothetical protein EYN98_15410 [Candidatus Poribacteria bacterium]|nr:hypothetical protein [Candidatus Poribacteria bacterium]